MYSIAVLITSFNRRDTTLRSLHNLFSQDDIGIKSTLKVFLVDDASKDGTAAAVAKYYPEVNLINGNGTLYWNRGMYTAWESASKTNSDFYLWLNDDTFLYKDAITKMIDTSTVKNHESIIVGSTQSIKNKKITYGGRNGEKLLPVKEEIQKCLTFNGNFVLIPKRVFEKIGNLDYRFRHSFGDIEYGLRANRENIDVLVAPFYIGTCEGHEDIKSCFSPKIPLLKRFKHFYSPLGMNPFEFFYLNKKHKGLLSGISVFITTHLRVLIPQLWLLKNGR